LTACSPLAKVGAGADEVLFERGMSAARQKRFTACYLDLETLVNTYAVSQYARKARIRCRIRRSPIVVALGSHPRSATAFLKRRSRNNNSSILEKSNAPIEAGLVTESRLVGS
jgi:hypothetical protein